MEILFGSSPGRAAHSHSWHPPTATSPGSLLGLPSAWEPGARPTSAERQAGDRELRSLSTRQEQGRDAGQGCRAGMQGTAERMVQAPAMEGRDWLQGEFLSRNFWAHLMSADNCPNALITPDPRGSGNSPGQAPQSLSSGLQPLPVSCTSAGGWIDPNICSGFRDLMSPSLQMAQSTPVSLPRELHLCRAQDKRCPQGESWF